MELLTQESMETKLFEWYCIAVSVCIHACARVCVCACTCVCSVCVCVYVYRYMYISIVVYGAAGVEKHGDKALRMGLYCCLCVCVYSCVPSRHSS